MRAPEGALRSLLAVLVLLGLGPAACRTRPAGPPLATVPQVDLSRYAGRWFEIARKPAPFEEGCSGSTAEYSLQGPDRLQVINSCWKEGRLQQVEGSAKVVPESGGSRLRVSFFGPFSGDYFVIGLDERNYSWAVVGEPRRRFLWFLSRTPAVTDGLLDHMKRIAADHGYALEDLILTDQSPNLQP